MAFEYIPPMGGTTLEGPVDEWQLPDGYWSEEFAAALETARVERQPVTCPICGQPSETVSMDAIYAERAEPGGFAQFAGNIGTLITLNCGHKIKR